MSSNINPSYPAAQTPTTQSVRDNFTAAKSEIEALQTATANIAVTTSPLSQFAATTSAQLASVISDETGSGSLVFGTSPTLASPTINGTIATSGLTMPAFTLGGTVSGGGNQLNNVVIGTSTPLAGSFTTLSATGLASFGATNKLYALEGGAGFSYFTNAANGVGNGIAVNATTSILLVGGSSIATASSTGLAVTGTLASTNGNGSNHYTLTNSTDGKILQIENNASGQTLYTDRNAPWITYVNGVEVSRTSSTGLAVTGTLSATGKASAASMRVTGVFTDDVAGSMAIDDAAGAGGRVIAQGPDAVTQGAFYVTTTLGDGTSPVTVGTFSSTGLAVTGTLSATGIVSTTAGGMTIIPTTTTSNAWTVFKNAGGANNSYVGLDASAPGLAVAYSFNVWNGSNTPIIFGVNNAEAMRLTPTALTLGSGVNLVMAAGQGIDFSATSNGSGTTTSEVLSDYEEGTWTPTDGSGAGLSLTGSDCKYTKIGRLVTVSGLVQYPATANGSGAQIGGLPFTPASQRSASGVMTNAALNVGGYAVSAVASLYLYNMESEVAITNAQASGKNFTFSHTYST